jgi:gag-polypeptide of LTR copia-type/Domain of unknown function (DUF4219)
MTTTTQAPTDKLSTHLYDIPYLEDDGANYQAWKYRVQTVLEIRGLWKAVEGTESDSVKVRDARAQIILTLKDEPFNGVIRVVSAKDVWEKLSTWYEGKGTQQVAYLIGELFHTSLMDTEPLEPQINKIRRTARTLTALKNEIKDNLVAITIILSLPASYSTLQTILMSLDSQSTEDVTAKILAEESRRWETAAQSVFMAKFHSAVKRNKDSSKKKKKCKNCGKHHAGECRKPKNDQKEEKIEKGKGDAVAKIAHTKSNDPIQLFIADKLAARRQMVDKWIVDSGASAPMSAHQD